MHIKSIFALFIIYYLNNFIYAKTIFIENEKFAIKRAAVVYDIEITKKNENDENYQKCGYTYIAKIINKIKIEKLNDEKTELLFGFFDGLEVNHKYRIFLKNKSELKSNDFLSSHNMKKSDINDFLKICGSKMPVKYFFRTRELE